VIALIVAVLALAVSGAALYESERAYRRAKELLDRQTQEMIDRNIR